VAGNEDGFSYDNSITASNRYYKPVMIIALQQVTAACDVSLPALLKFVHLCDYQLFFINSQKTFLCAVDCFS